MKQVEIEFIDFLHKSGIFKAFSTQVFGKHMKTVTEYLCDLPDEKKYVTKAFPWTLSKERYNFWNVVNNNWNCHLIKKEKERMEKKYNFKGISTKKLRYAINNTALCAGIDCIDDCCPFYKDGTPCEDLDVKKLFTEELEKRDAEAEAIEVSYTTAEIKAILLKSDIASGVLGGVMSCFTSTFDESLVDYSLEFHNPNEIPDGWFVWCWDADWIGKDCGAFCKRKAGDTMYSNIDNTPTPSYDYYCMVPKKDWPTWFVDQRGD